jgi:hypothetical protein
MAMRKNKSEIKKESPQKVSQAHKEIDYSEFYYS